MDLNKLGLNSTMVRLKLKTAAQFGLNPTASQFHYGSIKIRYKPEELRIPDSDVSIPLWFD